jgi:serine/threonine protein kinase
VHPVLDPGRFHLQPSQVIASPETQLRYSIERLLGEGGFGQVYLARRLGRSAVVPEAVCIKVSPRIDGWLREAYFGQLKEIVYRCIGERRKRYETANELIAALTKPPAPLGVGLLRTPKGVHLAFTGILTKRRSEAVPARITLLNETQFWRLVGSRLLPRTTRAH